MRGLLTKASRRTILTAIIATPAVAMLHTHAGSAKLATLGSRQSVAMQPPASAALCDRLDFALLGDVMLGRYVDDQFAVAERKKGAFGDVLPVLNQLDPSCSIVAGNLECAVTSHPTPTPKTFNFKLHPQHADVLQQLQLSYVSLANNHVLDYQQQGMRETHQVLDSLGIAHSGSGLNSSEAQSPAIIMQGGHKVAFLSYADHYDDWAAGKNRPGINYIDPASSSDRQMVQQHIKAVQELHKPDLLLVFVHWGPNWRWQPDRHIRLLGREMLEAGADLVFGHSAHHIQGVEFIGKKAIIYGAGGFIDDYATDDVYRNELGCIWLATFSPQDTPPAAPVTPTAAAASAPDHPAAAAAAAGPDVMWPKDQAGDYHDAHEHLAAAADKEDVIRGSGMDQGAGSGSSSIRTRGDLSAAGGAPSSSCSGSVGRLRLHSLTAVPTAIHHVWREGQHKEPGHGDPPYFSQVDLAHGPDYNWVAHKLEQLCKDMGTDVHQLQDEGGLQLTAGLAVPVKGRKDAATDHDSICV